MEATEAEAQTLTQVRVTRHRTPSTSRRTSRDLHFDGKYDLVRLESSYRYDAFTDC